MARVQETMHIIHSRPLDQIDGEIGNALRFINNLTAKDKLPTSKDVDPNSPMEKKVIEWFRKTSFYMDNKKNLEINNFILCTIHRDLNTDVKRKMESIFKALLEIVDNTGLKIVLPLHPRTRDRMEYQLSKNLYNKINQSKKIFLIEPVGFLDMIALEKNAKIIVTDSGGVQKESFFFKKPCVILRPETEWVEIVNNGNAVLTDSNYDTIIKSFNLLLSQSDYTYPNFYGDGKASEFICNKIVTYL